jgi:DNA-binding transcriptional ArsR family regulator
MLYIGAMRKNVIPQIILEEPDYVIDTDYVSHARIFKAMGHPIRLQLLELIFDLELPVGAYEDQLEIPQAIISQHLAVLRRAGLVVNKRDGTTIRYRIEDRRILEVLKIFNEKLRGIDTRISKNVVA